jgi:hypothetical protein
MGAFIDGLNSSLAEHSRQMTTTILPRSRRHSAKKHLLLLEKRHPGLHPHLTSPLPRSLQGIKLGASARDALGATVMAGDSIDEPTTLPLPRSARPRVRGSTNEEEPPSHSRSSADPIVRKGRSSSQLRKPESSTAVQDPLISTNPTIDQIT